MPLSTARALWLATVAGLIPSIAIGHGLFWPGADWLDPLKYYGGRDFVNFWFGAHLALEGRIAEIYDLDAYAAAMQGVFAPAERFMNFSYPPNALPLLLPLGVLPYGLAWAVWTIGGLAAFVIATVGMEAVRARPLVAGLLVLSPAALLAASIGQATLFLAALLVGGLRILPTRPVLAGVLFGLASIKPQLGILITFVLLLRGAWRTIAAAAATVVVLLLLSLALFGSDAWSAYLGTTVPYQKRVLLEPFGFVWTLMASPFAWAYKVGIDVPTALKLHGGIALVIGALTLICVRACSDWQLTTAIIALASVLISPYALTYELTIPTAALLAYLLSRERPLPMPHLVVIGLFWATPYAAMLVDVLGVPVMTLLSLALLAALLSQSGVLTSRPQPAANAGQ